MTTEEKAQAYDEVLNKLRRFMAQGVDPLITRADVQDFFPELKESEDERIKKVLVDYFKTYKEQEECGIKTFYGIPTDSIIAWLEKQGEHAKFRDSIQVGDKVTRNQDGVLVNFSQLKRVAKKDEKQGEKKPIDKIEPIDEYEGLTDFERTVADVCIGWIGKEIGWKEYIKDNSDALLKIAVEKFNSVQDVPFEHNPTWSEEDECYMSECIGAIATKDGWSFEEKRKTKHWLKSLKDRYTWKPSDEEMKALADALSLAKSCGEDYSFDLRTLYEQLKKLKKYEKLY